MNFSVETVESISYTEFVALVHEENRPSGGEATIGEIIINSHLFPTARVLEVGCTTGFSSLEVARRIPVDVDGVDVCSRSIEIANSKLNSEKAALRGTVKFEVASAYDLPYADSSFDLLITGNASSFMSEKKKAIKEYLRVTKPNGFISMVPLWYPENPPEELILKVGTTIGCNLVPLNRQYWLDLLSSAGLEITYEKDYAFQVPSALELQAYCDFVLNRPHLTVLKPDIRQAIFKRLYSTMELFGENLSHMRFSIFLARKRLSTPEPQLFPRMVC